ncbi:MAG: MotA/TolQ/ExbB proton channel family protein [Gammaproteobacteria bacterium]
MTTKMRALICLLLLGVMAPGFAAQPGEIRSLDELLDAVRQGRMEQSRENQAREQLFLKNRNQQQALLEKAKAERQQLEQRSAQLEDQYAQQKEQLDELNRRLDARMGSLKELFGHLQTASSEASAQLQRSITSVEYPERAQLLDRLNERLNFNRTLPRIEDLEQLWYQQQREMVDSSKIKHSFLPVVNLNGELTQADVVRIGSFNLVSGNHYLQYIPETGKIVELPKQPPRYMLGNVSDFTEVHEGIHPIAIDPTRGALLNLLLEAPNFQERIEQGGFIGYVIIAIGALGLLLALERIIVLIMQTRKVADQMRSSTASADNPLGRILLSYEANKHLGLEALELKLGEAILRERTPLEKYLTLIKIISVIAPLLGLLGTVTGMINTFQTITLFGTGDPKLMAGGISQALITTVLGLVVAIPVVFFHTVANTRSKAILAVLEEQSTGLVAERAEQEQR